MAYLTIVEIACPLKTEVITVFTLSEFYINQINFSKEFWNSLSDDCLLIKSFIKDIN